MTGPKLNEAPVRARRTGARGAGVRNVRSTAKFVRVSPYKVRVVLNLIRGHDVVEAANILRFCERDAAITIGKVLHSAVSNAGANDDIPMEELYVSACYADEGPTIKRFRPRARGRTGAIRKRTSHITVVVSRLPESLLAEARNVSAQASANRARRTAGARATAEAEVADARREATGTSEVVAGATMAASGASLEDTRSTEPVALGSDAEDGAVTDAQQVNAELSETGTEAAGIAPLFTAPAGDADELNKIIGIGPKLAEQLNELGITKFAQLAEMSDADLERLDGAIPRSFDQISDWRTQAQEIIAGTWNRDTTNNT
jgi:large subunit ribosomal protein L22